MRRSHFSVAALIVALAALGGCGDDNKSSDTTVASAAETTSPAETTTPVAVETTAVAVETTAATAETTVLAETTTAAATGAPAAGCAKADLKLVKTGTLSIGTDSPAFPPWFADDKPENGRGFESAVAYAVAEQLGFTKDEVKWVKVAFNASFAPGKKDFDFDINQISITAERQQSVDFSDGYYEVNQAVVALNDSPAAAAKSIADLSKFKFGAQVGTTSLDFITNTIKPAQEAFVYDDTNGAKAALNSKQIDAIVVDLPTAFFISAVEIENSKVVGQFASAGGGEQFGLLFEKGNPLVSCVNQALASLRSSGKLAQIQQAELADATSAPVLP